ncbi:hypothetical protein ADU80_00395 (plasmid) [Clostridium botulinum]|uniref:DUF3037 domain-containing protein n=1 Tax=Clostridium botulinum TaxID=1491 RepID=A0A9Q1ZAM5_CLOBO|nr:DUF3037 domain-containing protein [Clostridium botulinum]AEB77347.1 hypothetical protein CbC4_4147 [Clostridium botulinum BKT015925]KEH96335.1 hypothetical protein Y848_13735 [Clostridium botulinum C/D str. Sp77]KLU74440.1 hypothetical protein CBC3_p0145 [Clostridium botulinum V891]KOA79535.1 hypothetical protein ADU77_03920 [Clostridium botulinum]KOA85010.1 hypothetical protein ADU74_10090 [Clostridium botulinum]
MKIYFSVLSYHPSFITDESINVAILFYNEKTDERNFEITTKWQRVQSFDDEVNIDILKLLLKGMQCEIQNTFWSREKSFNIYNYTDTFINELRFSKIYTSNTDNMKSFVEKTKKMFLRYDYNKKDRPNTSQQVNYFKHFMKSNNIKFYKGKTKGEYSEPVNYDYFINEYAFKIFTFANKNLSKIITSVKAWAFTAAEMEEKNYKTIFIYDTDIEDDKFKTIYEILRKSSYKLFKIKDAMEFISELENDKLENESLLDFLDYPNLTS